MTRACRRIGLALVVGLTAMGGLPGTPAWAEGESDADTLEADDGAHDDKFGTAVALEGDTALVTAEDHDDFTGAAYAFEREDAGWKQRQKITAEDATERDAFGHALALAGDTAVITAPRASASDHDEAGAAYVFERNDGTWEERQKLVAEDAGGDLRFGSDVAVTDDTIVVGAKFADTGGDTNAGAAYIFVRGEDGWSQHRKLSPDDRAKGDQFGKSVALADDTLVVGANADGRKDHDYAGSVYVFVRKEDDWNRQEKLRAPTVRENAFFGARVALHGDTVVVGAPGEVRDGGRNTGSAYVFVRDDGAWESQSPLAAPDPSAGDRFGHAVALGPDLAVVGAPGSEVDDKGTAGAAHVFARDGGEWTHQGRLTDDEPRIVEKFGTSVAIDGRDILVGTPKDGPEVSNAPGAAQFHGSR